MARLKGIASFSANFEPQISAPLDARYVVDTLDDLTTLSTWQAHDGETYLYNGMLVAVVNDPNSENNGFYYLQDVANYNDINYWKRIMSSSDIGLGLDGANNLVVNGSFLYGLRNWNFGLSQTTAVVDAPVSIMCRSGKAAFVQVPINQTGFLENSLVLENNHNYTHIFVRFSVYAQGDGSTTVVKIMADDPAVDIETWNIDVDTPTEIAAIVDITGRTYPKLVATQNASSSESSSFYLYDVVVVPVIQSSTGTLTYTNLEPSTAGAAGLPPGSTFNNMTFAQFMDAFFYPELFGTLTPPSSTFTSTIANGTLREIGELIPSIQFTATFDRGSINPQYQSASPYRSGPPNTYYYTGAGLPSSVPSTNLSDVQTINNYTVLSGTQSWTNYVAYDAGVQPKGSKGTNYDSPLPAGNTAVKTTSIIGVYPWFATSVNITTMTKQALALHTATYYQVTMVAETDTDKQKADFPVAFNAITGVQFYNTISGQWEWINGSKANSLLVWAVTDVQHNVQGNMVNYKRYTHTGAKIGSRQLRFYTT